MNDLDEFGDGPELLPFRLAPSGMGELAGTWADKPHRLVYDLIRMTKDARAECERLRAALSGLVAQVGPVATEDPRVPTLFVVVRGEPLNAALKSAREALKGGAEYCPLTGATPDYYPIRRLIAAVRNAYPEARTVRGFAGGYCVVDYTRPSTRHRPITTPISGDHPSPEAAWADAARRIAQHTGE